MKVRLINLDIQDQFDLSGSGWVPPLGLISIATYLKEKKGITPIIYDSAVSDKQEVIKEILEDCDRDTVLGFYVSILNYHEVIDLARKAKNKGAIILLGGPHVSSLEKTIMKKRKFVDAVISGQGEIPFELFLEQGSGKKIPNVIYRRNGRLILNQKEVFDINRLSLDYSTVELGEYWRKFENKKKEVFKHPVSYYTQKGCGWGKCIFCAIPEKKLTRKAPKKVWEEIQFLKEKYEIDYIYETGDSFTDDPEWLEELARIKPSFLDVSWEIFSRATITEEIVKNLKKIGAYKVCLGIESGNAERLKEIKKGHTLENVMNTTKLLRKYKIKLLPSYMCGVIGETTSSLKDTITFAQKIREISDSREVLVFPMTPLPNSTAYRMLLSKPQMQEKYNDKDSFDLEELHKDWCKYFCRIDTLESRSAIEEIKNVYRI